MDIYHQLFLPHPVKIDNHKLIGYQPIFDRKLPVVQVDAGALRIKQVLILNAEYLAFIFLYDIFIFSVKEKRMVARRQLKRQVDSVEQSISRNVLWVTSNHTQLCFVVSEHG